MYAQGQTSDTTQTSRPIPTLNPQPLPPPIPTVDQMAYQFPMYPPLHPAPRHLNPAGPGPWHTIGASQPIPSTSQPHIIQRLPPPAPPGPPQDQTFREGTWDGYHSPEDMSTQQTSYDYSRFREDQNWVPPDSYYSPAVWFFPIFASFTYCPIV